MAHGDYRCCAICDCKRDYVGLNDSFKDDICSDCREKSGLATVKQLMEKLINFESKTELKKWIAEVGFSECYYQNEVDDLVSYKLTGKAPEKFKSAIEFLGAVIGELKTK